MNIKSGKGGGGGNVFPRRRVPRNLLTVLASCIEHLGRRFVFQGLMRAFKVVKPEIFR